jgi:hypothetical protein
LRSPGGRPWPAALATGPACGPPEPDRGLRSLDAIHLATARMLVPDLDAIVSYDDRLTKAADDAGLPTVSPRD